MSEEAENKVQIKTEPKEEAMETEKEEEKPKKDFVKELYKMHGGDPREVKLENCVMLSRIPTDFMADTHEQFAETIKNILSGGHGLNQETIAKVIRIPKLEDGAPESNALRALICFTDLINKSRCMGRKKDFEDASLIVTTLTELPAELLDISDEDACILGDMVDENGDDDGDDVGEEVDEMIEDDDGHDEHDDDEDMEEDKKEENDDTEGEEKDDEKKDESTKDGDKKDDKKQEVPKKKVYEDEDEKAPFEMQWEGAPEFQWRLCEGPRDEKKLIIDNLLWADLNNVFIYRTIQKATSVDINFPARFTSEGTRASHGKLSLYFPGFVAIMDEALKHLVYFRSGDNRRIKVFLPQTTISLKRKEEFEGKLGRLIKPTPRMMELVIKILPEGYTPTSDDAVNWFPMQSVIDCELVNDEMGKPCAIVKFETAEEAVAAHASKSFINISQKVSVKADPDGKDEKEEDGNVTQCNVFMRGVEAHFGSLLTFYDQKKKAQEQRSNRRKSGGPPQQQQSSTSSSAGQKRPAGSTIRGAAPVPPAKKNRTQSPKRPHGKDNSTTPRGGRGGSGGGGSRNSGRGGSSGGGGPRRSSPPSRSAPRSAPRGGGGRGGNPRGGSGSGGSSRGGGRGGRSGGDRGLNRSAPRSSGSNYRNDSFSSSSSQRGPARPDPFSGYGYAQFENRYNNDRPTIDPFGRPVYGNSAFSNNSSSSSFHRGGGDDHRGGNSGSNFSSFQDRRRY